MAEPTGPTNAADLAHPDPADVDAAALEITKRLEGEGNYLWTQTVRELCDKFLGADDYMLMKAATNARRITRGLKPK